MRPLCIPDTCNMTGPARAPAHHQVRRREKHKFRFLCFFQVLLIFFVYVPTFCSIHTLTSLSVLSLMQSLCNFICFHTLEIPNFMVAEKSLLCLFLPIQIQTTAKHKNIFTVLPLFHPQCRSQFSNAPT